jgi:cytochrome d ubiquinol oxidase subunit II
MDAETLAAVFLILALNVYALTGGADFGGGVWDLLAGGPRKNEQRHLIKTSVAPIWEANHVWLIIVLVVLFACFPLAYTAVVTALHIPLSGMLVGIVLRGSAFVFRGFEHASPREQVWWGRVFEWSSVITPVLLGVCLGAMASGGLRVDVASRRVLVDFVSAWWQPFVWMVGAMCLALFAWLAAVYLALAAPAGSALQGDFRRRALWAGVVTGLVSAATLGAASTQAPQLFSGLTGKSWPMAFALGAGVMAVLAMMALRTRRHGLARLAAGAQVSGMVWAWALAQHPFMAFPDVTVHAAAAPASVIRAVLWALGAGCVVLLPAFVLLFAVFKPAPAARHR